MNFVFISPNFPDNYYQFTLALRRRGVCVCAIADTPYELLSDEVKNSIDDYYQVSNLEDIDEKIRAIGYFTFRHGKIDWIESNNEYWLESDAFLRECFHVTSGFQPQDMARVQHKSLMKEYFNKAKVKSAEAILLTDLESALAFANQVGYPLVLKPDQGVGASNTHKIYDEHMLKEVFAHSFAEPMLLEAYVNGRVFSYDGIVDLHGQVIFETSHIYLNSLMDAVNEDLGTGCYSILNLDDKVSQMGRAVIEAFAVRSRFFHLEFFELSEDQRLGSKGDILALEVNMRPPGGFIPDMINSANDFNVYQLWADMIVDGTSNFKATYPYSCCFVGRKNNISYKYDDAYLCEVYKANIMEVKRMPDIMATAMGNTVYIARFPTYEEVMEFVKEVNLETD